MAKGNGSSSGGEKEFTQEAARYCRLLVKSGWLKRFEVGLGAFKPVLSELGRKKLTQIHDLMDEADWPLTLNELQILRTLCEDAKQIQGPDDEPPTVSD